MNAQTLRKLRDMSAHVDGDSLVLEPLNGSPRVVFTRLPSGQLLRDGAPMTSTDLYRQLELDGAVALWLRDAPLELSFLPVDTGFDLRVHPEIAIELPPAAAYRVSYLTSKARRTVAEGDADHVSRALAEAGYTVAGQPCEVRP